MKEDELQNNDTRGRVETRKIRGEANGQVKKGKKRHQSPENPRNPKSRSSPIWSGAKEKASSGDERQRKKGVLASNDLREPSWSITASLFFLFFWAFSSLLLVWTPFSPL